MTPAEAIAMLDRQLADHGEDVTHHVMTSGAEGAGTPLRAFVRGFKPDELIEGITQKDRKVTISPASGVALSEANRIKIGGKAYRVEAVEAIRMGGTVVRYNVMARG